MPGKEWTFEACWQSIHLEVMILEELSPASFELFLGTSAALLLFVRPLFLSVRPWLLTRVPIPRSSADSITVFECGSALCPVCLGTEPCHQPSFIESAGFAVCI